MGTNTKIPTARELEESKADMYNKTVGHENEIDGVECTLCLNKGLRMVVVEDAGNFYHPTVECKCMAERRFRRRMKESGLERFADDYTFDKYNVESKWQEAVKTRAMEYSLNTEGWFFMGGQVGCGKSHLCTAICNVLLKEGKRVKYMIWAEEINKLKAFGSDPEEREREIAKYMDAPVLYIDDLFKIGENLDGTPQPPTVADKQVAFKILNHRYSAKLPTIISTELTFTELLAISESIGSRIKEMAGRPMSINKDINKNYRMRDNMEF